MTPNLPAAAGDCSVVELRQYTLHEGRREELIELFDRELVETQEATGMLVMGQFRDLDRPDYFVWLRGFSDMASRKAALGAFYGGSVWEAHSDAANDTMIDSDDVLLLQPARANASLRVPEPSGRRGPGPTQSEGGYILGLVTPAGSGSSDRYDDMIAILKSAGLALIGEYETLHAENSFPLLPIRDANVRVIFAATRELEQLNAAADAARSSHPDLLQAMRLAPTSRSLVTAGVLRLAD